MKLMTGVGLVEVLFDGWLEWQQHNALITRNWLLDPKNFSHGPKIVKNPPEIVQN